ncbi:MAG: amidohydrolase [Alcaligenaceae bacterium]|nr:amidohydrolase [Alcaligenaceae bacterium]
MIPFPGLDEIVAIRRDIHAHPELCYEENRTAALVEKKLKEWGIECTTGIGVTGVVGSITAGDSGKVIGLRADMDALPMQEENNFAHRSRYDGKMHGCGHDGHTAILLAAARHLSETRNFNGTVRFIFQPAEEGGAGAKAMIDDGLFERFPCDAVFGMHNWPGMIEGGFSYRAGPLMASSNIFRIDLHGKGGHAAAPQDSADPIPAITQLVQSLQTIVSRNLRPIDAAVLSVTQIHSGTATNVIPDHAWIAGAVRAFSNEAVDLVEERMQTLAAHIAASHGCTSEVVFERRYPALVNSEAETALCAEVMRELYGEKNAEYVFESEPVMPSEDFAFMLQELPGSYVFLGNGDGSHRQPDHGLGPCMLHNPSYDFNDRLLGIGASYWVRLAEKYLS